MKWLREMIYLLADLLGVNCLFRRLTSGRVRVLMYHGVATGRLPTYYWTLLDRTTFLRQMQFIKRKFEVARLSSLVSDGRRGRTPVAAVTFDDGLKNTYTQAWPILKQLGLVATCFVIPGLSESGKRIWADELYTRIMAHPDTEIDLTATGYGVIPAGDRPERAGAVETLIDQLKSDSHQRRTAVLEAVAAACGSDESSASDELELMTREQIVELGRSDEFEIAGHSDGHPILSTLTPEEQAREIESCLNRLQSWGVDAPPLFAYPNGRPADFDEHTVSALKRHGVKAAVTTIDGLWDLQDDPFRIPRVAIGADISMAEFKCRLSGFFYFLRCVRHTAFGRRAEGREA